MNRVNLSPMASALRARPFTSLSTLESVKGFMTWAMEEKAKQKPDDVFGIAYWAGVHQGLKIAHDWIEKDLP